MLASATHMLKKKNVTEVESRGWVEAGMGEGNEKWGTSVTLSKIKIYIEINK